MKRPDAYGSTNPKSSPQECSSEKYALLSWLDSQATKNHSQPVTDAYESWIASRRHHGDTAWSHVTRCRALVSVFEEHGIDAVLELLERAAERGWKGLRAKYAETLPHRTQSQPERRRGGVWDQLEEATRGGGE